MNKDIVTPIQNEAITDQKGIEYTKTKEVMVRKDTFLEGLVDRGIKWINSGLTFMR